MGTKETGGEGVAPNDTVPHIRQAPDLIGQEANCQSLSPLVRKRQERKAMKGRGRVTSNPTKRAECGAKEDAGMGKQLECGGSAEGEKCGIGKGE